MQWSGKVAVVFWIRLVQAMTSKARTRLQLSFLLTSTPPIPTTRHGPAAIDASALAFPIKQLTSSIVSHFTAYLTLARPPHHRSEMLITQPGTMLLRASHSAFFPP